MVAVAALGGLRPALAAAVASDLLVNFFFVPPFHTLTVEDPDHVIVLVVYVAVAVTVSLAVELAARQRATAARAGVEAALLARISAEPITSGSLTTLLAHVRDTLSMDSCRSSRNHHHRPAAARRCRANPKFQPDADNPRRRRPAADSRRPRAASRPTGASSASSPRPRPAPGRPNALPQKRSGPKSWPRSTGSEPRCSPRSAMTCALRWLQSRPPRPACPTPSIVHSEAERAELLATIEESTDRMADLVENLLAMSRLQAGALSVHRRPTALDEVVATALSHLPATALVEVDVPDDLAASRRRPRSARTHRRQPGRQLGTSQPDGQPTAHPCASRGRGASS